MAEKQHETIGNRWYSDESFWITYAPYLFDEKRWAEAESAAGMIVDFVRSHQSETETTMEKYSVLDACCGPGRFALEFARKGHAVTAIDIVQPFIDALKETADIEKLAISAFCSDILAFDAENTFDITLNLYTSFGYFPSEQDDIKLLASMYRALKPGGWFFLEVLSKELCAKYFTDGEWFEKDGALVCTQFTVDDGWNYLNNRWIVCKDGHTTDTTWKLRLYSFSDLQRILHEIGFTEIQSYGSFTFNPYNQMAQTLLVAARK